MPCLLGLYPRSNCVMDSMSKTLRSFANQYLQFIRTRTRVKQQPGKANHRMNRMEKIPLVFLRDLSYQSNCREMCLGSGTVMVIYRTWDGCASTCTLCTLVDKSLAFLKQILVIHLTYPGFLDNVHLHCYISLHRMEKPPFSALKMPEKGFYIFR